jgi:hypothetical protein
MSLFDDLSNSLSSTVNAASSTINNAVGGLTNTVSSAVSSIPQSVSNLSITNLTNLGNVSASRLAASGLSSLAVSVGVPTVGFNIAGDNAGVTPSNDWRVKLSLPPSAGIFYQSTNPGIQWPLQASNGVIFPYTPTVSVTHSANYDGSALTHSNYMNFFYKSSYVQNIQITGEFSVQNVNEGLYLIAVIEFFRSCTKMFFGQDALAGNPPPVLNLNGYGATYLPNVPVVVESFQHTMAPDVDYINIPYISPTTVASGTSQLLVNNALSTRMPTTSQIQITLLPIYSRAAIHNQFTLTQFAAGNLIAGAGNFI